LFNPQESTICAIVLHKTKWDFLGSSGPNAALDPKKETPREAGKPPRDDHPNQLCDQHR